MLVLFPIQIRSFVIRVRYREFARICIKKKYFVKKRILYFKKKSSENSKIF